MAVAVRVGPTTDTRSDHDLVAAVRRGDDGAFETLFDRYQRRITAFAFGMVGDWARAEDVTQDVFISALRRMRETERPIAFKPWVYEIAKNACIDQFRRSRRAEEVSYDADERMAPADLGRLADTGPVPEVAAEHKQQLDDLVGAFGGLSRSHHDILVLRELEGLTYRQIGERMGLSRPSVESTLFRARRRLGEEYDDLSTGRRCERVRATIAGAAVQPLGVRDRGRVSRHLAHCQPCRRHAVRAGAAAELFERPSVRTRVAAVLPLPVLLRPRHGGRGSSGDTAGAASAHLPTTLVHVAATSDHSLWAKAAAAGLTVVVAAGASVATHAIIDSGQTRHAPSKPRTRVVPSPARPASHAGARISPRQRDPHNVVHPASKPRGSWRAHRIDSARAGQSAQVSASTSTMSDPSPPPSATRSVRGRTGGAGPSSYVPPALATPRLAGGAGAPSSTAQAGTLVSVVRGTPGHVTNGDALARVQRAVRATAAHTPSQRRPNPGHRAS